MEKISSAGGEHLDKPWGAGHSNSMVCAGIWTRKSSSVLLSCRIILSCSQA